MRLIVLDAVLFRLIDGEKGGDVRKITARETGRILDTCFQCKLCEVNCPYTPRDAHEYRLDFPKLVHRFRALRAREKGLPLRDWLLADPDGAGRMARASLGLANLANRMKIPRWFLEKTLGIHRDKLLPDFARQSFETWAEETGRIAREPSCEAVLFPTCFVEHNAPEIGRDTIEVFEKNRVDIKCAKGLCCCGMPAWEKGDLESVQARAKRNLRVLLPFVDNGAKVVVINPTCAMMFRREYPQLVAAEDRAAAARVAAAIMEPTEFLWSIRNEERFNADFKSTPGGPIACHAPCHLRAQAIGFRGRDLLRKIPGVQPILVQECCGHDGTYAMTVAGFEPLIEIDDAEERAVKLREWLKLPGHVYALLEDGTKIRPTFDRSQVGNERLSSVQYLKFPARGTVPIAIGIDLPGIEAEIRLGEDQRTALAEDLA